MAAYATQAEFEGYVEGWVTQDAPALVRMLERASFDLDSVLGFYDVLQSGTYAGYKIDPTTLDYPERQALRRATCAQAWYRHEMGEEHFVRPIHQHVSGPEFTTDGPADNVGPLALRELAGSGLLRNVTSIANKRPGPRWWSFSYNIEED